MANETTEQKFRNIFKNRKGYWIRKLRVDYSSTPFDYLILTEKYNYATEVKEWKKGKFFYPEQRIDLHQIVGLQRFNDMGNLFISYILINRPGVFMVCIPLETWLMIGRARYTVDDFTVGIFSEFLVMFDDLFINAYFPL